MKNFFKKISLVLALVAIFGSQTGLASAAYYGTGTTGTSSSSGTTGTSSSSGTTGTSSGSTCGTCSTTGTTGTSSSTSGSYVSGTQTSGSTCTTGTCNSTGVVGESTSPTGEVVIGTPTPGTGGNGGNDGNINTQDSHGYSTPHTYEAGPVTGTTVTFNGMVESNGLTEVWFEYGTTNGSFSNTYGYRKVGNGKYDIVSTISNLSGETTYYYRLASKNASNIYHGEIKTFTTGRGYPSVRGYGQPYVETTGVRYVSPNSAVVVAKINANAGSTTYWFEYGTSSVSSMWNGRTMLMSVSADTYWYERAYGITGLAANTTYYYRVVAQNPNGTSYGLVKSFTTPTYASYNTSNVTYKPTVIKKYSGATSSSSDTEDISSDEVINASIILDSFVSKDEAAAGDEIKLTLTYRNTGDKKAKDAILKVSLPSEVEFVSSNVTPSSKLGSELKFTLGNISGSNQSDIEIIVKVKKTVEPGSSIAFNSFLEYYDEDNKLQTVNAFNSVMVKDASSLFSGFALFSGIGGNIFTIILLLMVLAALLYLVATRKQKRG